MRYSYIGQDKNYIYLCRKGRSKIRKIKKSGFGPNEKQNIVSSMFHFILWPPFWVMALLSLAVCFILGSSVLQRSYIFNRSVTSLNPLLASLLVPVLCAMPSVFLQSREANQNMYSRELLFFSVIGWSVVLVFFINFVIQTEYGTLDIPNSNTGELQQYFGSTVGEYASGRGRLFDSEGNLIYLGEFQDNQYHGYGKKYEFINAIHNSKEVQTLQCTYEGFFKQGLPDGYGREYCYDMDYTFEKPANMSPYLRYEGEFKEGKYSNYGVIYNYNEKYEGMFNKGQFNGSGTKIYWDDNDKTIYKIEGSFENGGLTGQGEKYYSNGNLLFVGTYQSNKAVRGTAYYRDGSLRYEGDWDGSDYNGSGTLYWSSGGQRYVGSFDYNSYSGSGTLYWENGECHYDGNWSENMRNGYGVSYREDGTMEYAGYWENDKRSTYGTSYRSDGTMEYAGYWKDDQYNGTGKQYYEDGQTLKYEGEFVAGFCQDNGTSFYRDGTIQYTGEFKNGKRNGYGTWYWENGAEFYVGEFLNDNRNGEGIVYERDGSLRYSGSFQDDVYHGVGTRYWTGSEIPKYVGHWQKGTYSGSGTEYNEDGSVLRSGFYNNGEYISSEEEI